MKNQTEKTKLSTPAETLTFGNDSSLIIKKSVGAGIIKQTEKTEYLMNCRKILSFI